MWRVIGSLSLTFILTLIVVSVAFYVVERNSERVSVPPHTAGLVGLIILAGWLSLASVIALFAYLTWLLIP